MGLGLDKRIILIEFDYHPEVLRGTIEIFQNLPYDIDVYVLERIWGKIELDTISKNVKLYIASDKKDSRRLIKENIDSINEANLIIFNTLASQFAFFTKLNLLPPVVLRIHNSNAYLDPWNNLDFGISSFYLKKDLCYLLGRGLGRMELYWRSKFVREKVTYFCFPNNIIEKYAIGKGYVEKKQVVPPFPFVFSKNTKGHKKTLNECMEITIVGAIDKRRRDYEIVFNAFNKILPFTDIKIKLNLLGKPIGAYGKGILKKFSLIEDDYFRLNYYNQFVPDSEFDDVMVRTDFLIIPIVFKGRYRIFKEIYGKTKISGNINDMILFHKPALLPDYYEVEKPVLSYIETYNSTDNLAEKLKSWIKEKQFMNFNMNVLYNIYQLDRVSEEFACTFKEILEKNNSF